MTEHTMVSSERQKGNCSTPTVIDYNCDNEGCFYHYSEEHIEDHKFYTKLEYKSNGTMFLVATCSVCTTSERRDVFSIKDADRQTITYECLKLQDKVLVRACQHHSNYYYEIYINGNWECRQGLETCDYQALLGNSVWIATDSIIFEQTVHPTLIERVEEYLQTYMANN
jgi:hypothetical protein